jgi:hypothetical protein
MVKAQRREQARSPGIKDVILQSDSFVIAFETTSMKGRQLLAAEIR